MEKWNDREFVTIAIGEHETNLSLIAAKNFLKKFKSSIQTINAKGFSSWVVGGRVGGICRCDTSNAKDECELSRMTKD